MGIFMIHIVGGFYKELCLYPSWDYFFGSAGRATAILSKFDVNIDFHTYVHPQIEKKAEYFSNIYDINLHITPSTEIISFEYYHALSAPNIHTLNKVIEKQERISVEGDIVICYGMMEADIPLIKSEYAIYDPQSEDNPLMIFENDSTIQNLAIVLNVEESKKYTQKSTINEVAKDMFTKSNNLKVLILKDGPFGAHLFYQEKYYQIDAFETDSVFKIGSGDVFVAVFGYLWAKEKQTPIEAAKKASFATALYCNNQCFQLEGSSLEIESDYNLIKANKENFKKKVYLAGPFFTMADRWLIEEAKFQLEKFGANVFSPLHDVGYGEANIVAQEDLKGVDEADILYAVLNDYDPGTIFEIGYAISKNIPVVIFIENKTPINMTMFEGSGCIIETDFSTSIYKVIWEALKTT